MKTTKWQCPVADVGGITQMIIKEFLNSPWAPWFNIRDDGRKVSVEVHSYREEGTALVVNIGVNINFHGIVSTKLGRIYL